MSKEPRIIEMTLEGDFVSPSREPPRRLPVSTRFVLWATVVAILAMTVAIVVLTIWFVMMILPFVFGAAAVAYLAHRYQVWRHGKHMMMWHPPGR